MATVAVREATLADSRVLAELRWRLRTESAPAAEGHDAFVDRCANWFDAALSSGDWLSWLCESDRRTVGHLALHLVPKIPNPVGVAEQLGYVTSVFVDPAERNQGVGRLLLEAAVAEARRRRLECLVLWPTSRSVPFYRRAGFAPPDDILELRLDR